MFDPFEEDEEVEAIYENGHWVWDDDKNELFFERELSTDEEDYITVPPLFGNIEFKDDLDPIEQMRYMKRFQRKSEGEYDVIFLQDIKDIALYTAPVSLLTPTLVNILHHPATERLLRALILYCQYYLQTADEMSRRMLELETKVRTIRSEQIESEYRDNLEDLRLLIAKEYVAMLLGTAEFKKHHHMGINKKMRSLSKRDIIISECLLRVSIQIVWLALGRTSFHQIELEMNRIFKSQIFNLAEHKHNTNYINKLMPKERVVLFGNCLRQRHKLITRSPLINELLCVEKNDFRLLGLAAVRYPVLTHRLRYLEKTLSLNERLFQDNGIILGILGLPRLRFDIMLREIKIITSTSSSCASMRARSASRTSRTSTKQNVATMERIYGQIFLPSKKYDNEWLPKEFPQTPIQSRYCNPLQRLKWMVRAVRVGGRCFSVMRQYRDLRPLTSMHTTRLNKWVLES